MINFLIVIYIIDIQWFSIILNMLYSIFYGWNIVIIMDDDGV